MSKKSKEPTVYCVQRPGKICPDCGEVFNRPEYHYQRQDNLLPVWYEDTRHRTHDCLQALKGQIWSLTLTIDGLKSDIEALKEDRM